MKREEVRAPNSSPHSADARAWVALLLVLFLLVGCQALTATKKSRYTWAEEPIPEDLRAAIFFTEPIGPVAIIADKADDGDFRVAREADQAYYTSKAYLSNALAKQLGSEIRSWGGESNVKAKRSLAVLVREADVQFIGFVSQARIEFEVTTGSGVRRELSAHYSAEEPTLRALDRVIARAAARILEDVEVAEYLSSH